MESSWLTTLGLVAGCCTTFSFLPQVHKAIRTKTTKDLSLGMYSILAFGLFLWMIYGIILKDLPLILANGVSFSLASLVLFLKIRHG